MKMRPRGAAGRSHARNGVAARHLLADPRAEAGQMGVAGQDAVAMRDLDHIAIAAALADETDLARCGGQDRLAHAARKIQARAKGRMAATGRASLRDSVRTYV